MVTGGRYGGGYRGGGAGGGGTGRMYTWDRGGGKIPVSPARLASCGLSYIGKAPKFHSHPPEWPQTSSLMQGPEDPVLPARLASNSLSYMSKAPKSQSRRRHWHQIASLIYARPQNPSLAGETDLTQPFLYRQGLQIPVSPARLDPKSLSGTGHTSEIPVSPARLASYSLCYIGNAPKSQSQRRDWPQTASLI